ncbi:MAG TPA: PGPGW domain-containing protein [Acidimicrobiales bacterium]|nr:PGPGW domain-containing protein [Acidimicrobiales bacterium]
MSDDDHSLRHRLERLEEAAIAAEFETGEREETVEEAKAHLLVRIARILAGTFVVLAGTAMLVLPGPGLLVIAAGLSILSIDVPFARRLLDQVRARLPQDADGSVPRWVLVMSVSGLVVGIGLSVGWVLA